MKIHLEGVQVAKKAKTKSSPDDAVAYAVELLSAIGSPDQLTQLISRKPIDANTLIALVNSVEKFEISARQSAAANKRHEANQIAKLYIIDFWHNKRDKYKSNKEFSEAAAKLVSEKFSVNVRPETIARDWLRGVPASRVVKELWEGRVALYRSPTYLLQKISSTKICG